MICISLFLLLQICWSFHQVHEENCHLPSGWCHYFPGNLHPYMCQVPALLEAYPVSHKHSWRAVCKWYNPSLFWAWGWIYLSHSWRNYIWMLDVLQQLPTNCFLYFPNDSQLWHGLGQLVCFCLLWVLHSSAISLARKVLQVWSRQKGYLLPTTTYQRCEWQCGRFYNFRVITIKSNLDCVALL